MNNLSQAIWVELLKARRSRMPLVTALGCAMLPLVGGFFMIILRDPEMARRAGLISVKARILVGTADWPTYLGFISLAASVAGILVFGLVATWIFGREFADRTAKDLLALPTSRSAIVGAKFAVVGLWSLVLTGIIYLTGLAVGWALALPAISPQAFWHATLTLLIAALLNILLASTFAFTASAGHGYLPPFGVMILVIALAQVLGVLGWGEYFPWAIPGLLAQGEPLGVISYAIVLLTSLAGLAATFAWWEWADQTH
jgi:ABC-2 type transport system permease protein